MTIDPNEKIVDVEVEKEEVISSSSEYTFNSEYNKGLYKTEFEEKKKGNGTLKKIGVTLLKGCLIIALGFTSGFAGSYAYNKLHPTNNGVIIESTGHNIDISNDSNTNSITKVVEVVKDSVVEIKTESVVTGGFYYGDYVSEGAGSGVIITADGYIVTNNHVIDGASKITVTLTNTQSYEATLIGKDAQTDLALLKIEESNLKPAILGNSDELKVGEISIAIGNPLGNLGGTVTDGIISALSREITVDGQKMTLLQTNAAVNPGNSGGGLFNIYGELIGVVNAKSGGDNVEGLGFAIPINIAKKVIEDLMQNGYVTGRVKVGINLLEINDRQSAFRYGVNEYGVYIYATEEDSPASKAGLKSGDRIISVEDEKIETADQLKNKIQEYEVGDVITFKIERNGKEYKIDVTLDEQKS